MTVDVLGTKYTIKQSDRVKDTTLEQSDGYCDHSIKSIVIDTFKTSPDSLKNLDEYKKKVIRHELVHAFLFESGLDAMSRNEELVDWVAYQFPKLLKAFQETDCL